MSCLTNVTLLDEYTICIGQDGDGHRAGSRVCRWLNFSEFFLSSTEALSAYNERLACKEGMVNLYCTGQGFSDAAFAVPTSPSIDQFWHHTK